MKTHILKLILLAGVVSFSLSSCKSDKDQKATTEKQAIDYDSKEYASTYICPMHCEGSGAEQAGTCPVCGMDYVENKNKGKHHHDHSHDHHGHDHGDHNHDHDHGDHDGHNH